MWPGGAGTTEGAEAVTQAVVKYLALESKPSGTLRSVALTVEPHDEAFAGSVQDAVVAAAAMALSSVVRSA